MAPWRDFARTRVELKSSDILARALAASGSGGWGLGLKSSDLLAQALAASRSSGLKSRTKDSPTLASPNTAAATTGAGAVAAPVTALQSVVSEEHQYQVGQSNEPNCIACGKQLTAQPNVALPSLCHEYAEPAGH